MYPHHDVADYSGPSIFAPLAHSHFDQHSHLQSSASRWMPPAPAPAPAAAPAVPPPAPKASRKRSRDELDDLEPASLVNPDGSGVASMEVIEEPVMGEGMTLVDPHTGRSLAAESQTGTWYEDNIEAEARAAADAAAALEQERLDALGRPSKTVRLDSPGLGADGSAAAAEQPLAATATPAIDSASVMLGIGWKEVASDADMQCAARGWARYIENHYPVLGSVEMLCRSDGLEAFLVRASAPREGCWLFKDDLTEGRLIATSMEGTVANLRAQPIVFEGSDSLFAAASPARGSTPAVQPAPSPLEAGAAGAGAVAATGPSEQMVFD